MPLFYIRVDAKQREMTLREFLSVVETLAA
jgi:hypothetical protein